MIQIHELKEKVGQFENAVQMFWSQWGEKLGWVHFTNGYIYNGVKTKIYTAFTATNT